jgi:hypothetical protein
MKKPRKSSREFKLEAVKLLRNAACGHAGRPRSEPARERAAQARMRQVRFPLGPDIRYAGPANVH